MRRLALAAILTLLTAGAAMAQTTAQLCDAARQNNDTRFLQDNCPAARPTRPPAHHTAAPPPSRPPSNPDADADDAAYARAASVNTQSSYSAYLGLYPFGRHHAEASAGLDARQAAGPTPSDIPTAFDWVYQLDNGVRHWVRLSASDWLETWGGGNSDHFTDLGRTPDVNGCEGELLMRGDKLLEAFVPSRSCPSQLVIWEKVTDGVAAPPWYQLGQVFNAVY